MEFRKRGWCLLLLLIASIGAISLDTRSVAEEIPGFSTIVAEVGDISRFRSYRNLASYAGLVPCLDASGGKQRMGSITKQGSRYLRTALVEAAHVIPRMKKCRLNPFFRRRIVRGGYKKAIVATAHKLLKIVYYVWKNQTPYQETYPVCA